ncbi:MAG TPA: COX15/CtaA family protein [Vicinamibacterales bacterium]|nr:COX15/CtaA family protein [Vicinamibacterales bacterium]
MLHKFSKFLAACTVLLILAGSLVTSHDAGLSVPDWPTSYGWNMFTFPPSMWVANILYEHGHRLIASSVGFLTIVLVAWLWMAEPRRWLRWLGVAALAAVVAQGLLGGLTVLFFLPPAVSTAHAALAEIFFCLTVAIALFTSPGWQAPQTPGDAVDDPALRTFATATTVAVFVQILIGATMRHTGAGLAIPDFPLMFGRLVPDHWDARIAIHFAHRVGAGVVAVMVLVTARHIWRLHTERMDLAHPALIIIIFVVLQVTLGALTVLSRRQPSINSLHVVGGALVLATSLVITLRAWRVRLDAPRLAASTSIGGLARAGTAPPGTAGASAAAGPGEARA